MSVNRIAASLSNKTSEHRQRVYGSIIFVEVRDLNTISSAGPAVRGQRFEMAVSFQYGRPDFFQPSQWIRPNMTNTVSITAAAGPTSWR